MFGSSPVTGSPKVWQRTRRCPLVDVYSNAACKGRAGTGADGKRRHKGHSGVGCHNLTLTGDMATWRHGKTRRAIDVLVARSRQLCGYHNSAVEKKAPPSPPMMPIISIMIYPPKPPTGPPRLAQQRFQATQTQPSTFTATGIFTHLDVHHHPLLEFTAVVLEATHDRVVRGDVCHLQLSRHVFHAGPQARGAHYPRRATHLQGGRQTDRSRHSRGQCHGHGNETRHVTSRCLR